MSSTVSPQTALTTLYEFHTKWNFSDDNILQRIAANFQIDLLAHSQDEITDGISKEKQIVLNIGKFLSEFNLLEDRDVNTKFDQLSSKVHYAHQFILQYIAFKHGSMDVCMFTHTSLSKYAELKPFQKLLVYLFNYFQTNGLRRFGEYCYEEIKNPHQTRAWKQKHKIMDVIYQQFTIENNYTHWIMFTSTKDMDKQLHDHLLRTQDKRFPVLKKHRNIFSFRNGIYIAKRHTMHQDLFIEYTSPQFSVIDSSYVACKYFDLHFTNETETPTLDSIFQYQGLSPQTIELNKMFMGRMLYNVGQLDNWQVILMLLGTGGTGKSTISNIVKSFYDEEDVAVMGNNFQTTFGMADVHDKFLFIAPEIKRNWKIDQAEFQEIVSGGKININIKHQASISVNWKTPGILGGNENPGFVDNALSIQRRLVVTRFDKKVTAVDPYLSEKLHNEIGAIMKSCNTIYLQYAMEYSNRDIWSWLPCYFKNTQLLMATSSNALYAFIESDIVQVDSHNFVPRDVFFKEFNLFCSRNNISKPTINIDFYHAPFSKYGVRVLRENKIVNYNGRMYTNTTFLYGIDIFNYMS